MAWEEDMSWLQWLQQSRPGPASPKETENLAVDLRRMRPARKLDELRNYTLHFNGCLLL